MARYTAHYDFAQNPDCIYGILSDVERMSEFMPLCKRSDILSRRSSEDVERIEASLLLRYRQIDFERKVDVVLTLWQARRSIEMAAADIAFGSGSIRCTVTGVGRTGSRLLVEADYRIANLMVRLLFGRRLLRFGVDRIMDRVRQRAEDLYSL